MFISIGNKWVPEQNPVQRCKTAGCQRSCQIGSLYCLGHDPGPKDYQKFMEALAAELNAPGNEGLNAEGWVFPADEAGQIKLDGKELPKPLILSKAEFKGDVYFKSEFSSTDLTGARFHGDADFTEAQFKENSGGPTVQSKEESNRNSATFDGACFEQEVRLGGTIFYDDVSFIGCIFKAEVKMDGATNFNREAVFKQAQFNNEATISSANFEGTANFTEASFSKSAKFVDTKFHEQVLFERAHFAQLVDFSSANFFKSSATFVEAVFQQGVVFKQTQFLQGADVSFNNARFNGSVSFESTQFQRKSYFTETEFNHKVEFSSETKFTQPASFERTVFNEVRFGDIEFNQDTQFKNTRFNGWAEFSKTKFIGKTHFERAQFSHLTVFSEAVFGENVSFSVQVNERNRLAIRGSDLSKVKFYGSNVENIEFQDSKWIESKAYRWKITDEPPSIEIIKELRMWIESKACSWKWLDERPSVKIYKQRLIKLGEARRLYRQLRLNYDKVGAYEIAGRFYVSESEMSYLVLSPVYRWIHPLGLYKWASKYGQSISQGALVMFGLALFFTIFYFVFSALHPIWFREPPKIFGAQNMITLSWWESVWMGLQGSKPLADLGLSPKTITYWIVLIEGFIVPTQVGLFLLAVRRRFRRGD